MNIWMMKKFFPHEDSKHSRREDSKKTFQLESYHIFLWPVEFAVVVYSRCLA